MKQREVTGKRFPDGRHVYYRGTSAAENTRPIGRSQADYSPEQVEQALEEFGEMGRASWLDVTSYLTPAQKAQLGFISRRSQSARSDSGFWEGTLLDANGTERKVRTFSGEDGATIVLIKTVRPHAVTYARGTYVGKYVGRDDPTETPELMSDYSSLASADPLDLICAVEGSKAMPWLTGPTGPFGNK